MLRKKDIAVKPFRTDLSISEEIQAVADYVASKWEPVDNLPAIVKVIQETAFHDGRASFDGLDVGAFNSDIMRRRADLLGNLLEHPVEKQFAPMYDGLNQALLSFSSNISYYAEAALSVDGKWSFERQVRSAQITVERDFPGLASSGPKGWEAFKVLIKEDEDKIDYELKADKEAFAGSNIETHRSMSLVEQLALHNLHYGDESQGRKPQYALVGAIYSHFLNIQYKLVTQNLMMAIDKMTDWDVPELRFDIPSLDDSGNPLARLLINKVGEPRTEAEYRQSIAHKIEFDAKPKEEQEAIRKANRDEMMAEMSGDYFKDMDAQIASSKRSSVIELRKAFGTHKEAEPESPSL